HDVTGGNSTGSPVYSAAVGYDLVTGRGSPAANRIVTDLVGQAATTPGATHLSVAVPAATTAGASFGLTLTVLDGSNNPVTGYTGTVHFTSSDGQAILPADYTFTSADMGVHAFTATLKTAGSQTVTGTDTATSSITGGATVAVRAAAATV